MQLSLLALAGTTATAAAHLGRCDTSIADRLAWNVGARARLALQGYETKQGYVTIAPIGTISNPAGTYGVPVFDEEDAYGDAELCACLGGNTSVGASASHPRSRTPRRHYSAIVSSRGAADACRFRARRSSLSRAARLCSRDDDVVRCVVC